MDENLALRALKEADFDSTTHLRSIWQDLKYDVASLHAQEQNQIFNELDRLSSSDSLDSPPGMVLVGSGGTGKTHLLGKIRKQAFAKGMGFLLADMGNIRDFWESILQGYVNSLQENDANGIPQFKGVINSLIELTGVPISVEKLAQEESAQALNKEIQAVLAVLILKERQLTIKFRDVIRALLLLNSKHVFILSIGDNWLRGIPIDPEEKEAFGFSRTSMARISILEGLSWLISLKGPAILALDQLDASVGQARAVAGVKIDTSSKISEEQSIAIARAKLIIENIAEGLSNLYDKTACTLMVVSCIETTWTTLTNQTIGTVVRGRFNEPMPLSPILKKNTVGEMIEQRLKEAYKKVGFFPPYATWPFSNDFLNSAIRYYPREILRRCHEHCKECLARNQITVLDSFKKEQISKTTIHPGAFQRQDFQEINQAFEAAKKQVNLTSVFNKDNEDSILGEWLKTACYCLIQENPTSDKVLSSYDIDFLGRKYPSLHGRVSLIFKDEEEREKYLCLRGLQQSHYKTYQSRLKTAITESGIDKTWSDSRRLVLVRTHPLPGGPTNQEATQKFRDAGGLFKHPIEDEFLTLGALHHLKSSEKPSNFDQWLRQNRFVSQLPFIRDSVNWLFDDVNIQDQASALETVITSAIKLTEENDFNEQREITKISLGNLPVGVRLVGQKAKETISIRAEDLNKHTVILAGSGSGKTVLLRRIVEEMTLMSIPAIVIDVANDLARMGDRWTPPPQNWQEKDRQKANQYHQNTEVLIWTPGRETANPLNLNPLPDFSVVTNDLDELNQTIDMARDSLQDIVEASGKSASARKRRGVLRSALEYFAHNGSGNLEDFAELLSDLPLEAGGGISDPQKKAQDMADLLNAEISNNPLLRQNGTSLDPAVLFGLSITSKTRISVINFSGLTSLLQQQQFLNQLAMTLFTWIKKNPAPANCPLRGLLVIDEAKDFIPSGSSTFCKASIIRLAAQARKYGLGMIFATQAPKSIDHNIIANCSTQFYGRANSPASSQVIRDQLHQRGSSGRDVPKLQRGQFYAVSESLSAPVKILSPLCLSYHPPTPLDETEVIQRAICSRNIIHAKN